MTTGQRIKAARKKAGLTQIELAEKLKVPFQSVSQWERNVRNPKYESLQRIAEALGIEWIELVEERQSAQSVPEDSKDKPEVLSTVLERICHDMSQMTEEGQNKVADYASDILPRYRRLEAPQTNSAETGEITTQPPDAAKESQKPEETEY